MKKNSFAFIFILKILLDFYEMAQRKMKKNFLFCHHFYFENFTRKSTLIWSVVLAATKGVRLEIWQRKLFRNRPREIPQMPTRTIAMMQTVANFSTLSHTNVRCIITLLLLKFPCRPTLLLKKFYNLLLALAINSRMRTIWNVKLYHVVQSSTSFHFQLIGAGFLAMLVNTKKTYVLHYQFSNCIRSFFQNRYQSFPSSVNTAGDSREILTTTSLINNRWYPTSWY